MRLMRLGILFAGVGILGLAFSGGKAQAEQARTVTINIVQIVGTIDPAKISDYTDYMATANLYDGLVGVNSKGELVPELAEKWAVAPDSLSVTFSLRPDARFQDGKPVNAADVVYSIERLLKINQGPANLFAGVLQKGSVTAIDPKTVKFTLSKQFSPFLAMVPAIRIVNSALVQANAGSDDGQTYLASHVASAGAYRLKSWDRGTQMTLERDPDYYRGWDKGAIDKVRMVIANDEATVRALAASGELTMTSNSQSPDTYDVLRKMGRFQIIQGETATAFYLKLNSKRAPTDDIHVRRALALATDYETIRTVILPGAELTGPLPKNFAKDYLAVPAVKFDLEAAKAELAKSRYAGQEIPLVLTYVADLKFEEELGLLMQANLEKIGFKVELHPEPWNRITEIASKPETTPNITEVFFGPTYPSPDSMFYVQYDSRAAGTWASMEWAQNPEIDRLIDAARAAADPGEQATLYKSLQQLIIDQQLDVFVETRIARHAIDKCLEGYVPVPMQSFDYRFHDYKWVCP